MKALIIAAGRGKRLRSYTHSIPKPLIPVLGIPLIERIIRSVKRAGIRRIVVVTGYLGHKLKARLGNGSRLGVNIEYVDNPQWWQPNGISVLKAKPLLQTNFVLLMSDHLFDHKTLSELKRHRLDREESILCVDKSLKNIFDIHDATKVKVRKGKIEDIGKHLEQYNGIDTGMFLCSPNFFKVLERTIRRGFCSLSDAVRALATQRKARAYEITDRFWVDIDTPESLGFAEKIISSWE
ncbi:MAG: phosphocholine cytidylyltransferase family protein [Candidatus Latescibacteria bacterium]|nr:phosphocholine cytidylyltransferase family protein [Candidatus Latescibacterota bacterium]